MSKQLTRRDVLKAQAAGIAAAAAGMTAPAEAQPVPGGVSALEIKWSKAPCRFCGTGCGVMVGVKEGKVVAFGAVGTRKVNVSLPVTVNDRFHLGSDTKAMTALLAAMFVEQDKLRWDATVAEIFPELATAMAPGLQRVTLVQLLSHTSGIPSDNDSFGELVEKAMTQDGNLDELRYWLVQQWSLQPLAAEQERQLAVRLLLLELPGAVVPDLDRAGAVLAGGDLAVEARVLERMVLDVDGERLRAALERDALRHGPGRKRAVPLETEVVVEPARVVALHHEDGRVARRAAERLRGRALRALPLVLA